MCQLLKVAQISVGDLLSMVVVAALIGAGGMGFIVTEALANTRTGAGILAGIGIALLAMMVDRVVQKANPTAEK